MISIVYKDILKTKPKVSVIIPTINACEELDLAIRSILKNSDLSIELLIVVDPDLNTKRINQDILKTCRKYNLKPIINEKNLGPYGNWNKGAKLATTDWLIFATDDQYFAPHWDSELLKVWKPRRLVAGRLVEPGIIPVWHTNIKRDFGVLPSDFREQEFLDWYGTQNKTGFVKDGFFIPLLQHKKDYQALGGYATEGQFGTSSAVSNDDHYIKNALAKGYEFGTATSSYSYHFQASSWKKKTLSPKLSAAILTKNEEKHLSACLESLRLFTNDIIIIDSGSSDQTLTIAKQYNAKIYKRQFDNFATQRNFALTKVKDSDWVLFIDADEELEYDLSQELHSFAKDIYLDGVEIPRKNYIFDKWIRHSDWYPDYRLVFVRPKMVAFAGKVHERLLFVKGNGNTAKARNHLIHQNYDTVSEFVTKNLLTYPVLYAHELNQSGVQFSYLDLFQKPLAEFFRRFFFCFGWRDGLHGLVLSLLMTAQTLLIYIYLWEQQGKKQNLSYKETQTLFARLTNLKAELVYWLTTHQIENTRGVKRYFYRIKRKLLKLTNNL